MLQYLPHKHTSNEEEEPKKRFNWSHFLFYSFLVSYHQQIHLLYFSGLLNPSKYVIICLLFLETHTHDVIGCCVVMRYILDAILIQSELLVKN